MPLPSLVRREWHVVYQFPLAVGLITALNLAVTVWWDWSGVEGAFAFALNTAWMLLLTVVTVGVLGIVGLPLRFIPDSKLFLHLPEYIHIFFSNCCIILNIDIVF